MTNEYHKGGVLNEEVLSFVEPTGRNLHRTKISDTGTHEAAIFKTVVVANSIISSTDLISQHFF